MTIAAVAPQRYATLPRLAEGGTVVCLAPGQSLSRDDVEYVREKAVVIAINDAVDLAPWAPVAYSSDSGWWIRRRGLPDFAGLRVGVGSTPQGRPGERDAYERIQVLRLRQIDGVCFEPDGLATTINSGGAAINVAVHLGATRVLLLGYDMGPPKNGSNYVAFAAHIATMVTPLKEAGIAVLNCSRRTRLECFPRAELREALQGA
jgi:hypothetical protein